MTQTPPPDDPAHTASSSRPTTQRAWFPSQHVISYQSGGLPTFNNSQAGGAGAAEEAEAESGVSAWETRFGMRVDILAAAAYILGPVSGTPLRSFGCPACTYADLGSSVDPRPRDTQRLCPLPWYAILPLVQCHHKNNNKHVAYQSALLTGPLLLLRMLVSLLQLPQFLRTTFTFVVLIPCIYMS